MPENIGFAEGRALSYTTGMSYWLVGELLRDFLRIKKEAPTEEVARALQRSVEAEVGHRLPEIYPYLARVLDHPLEGAMAERVQFLGAEALQTRMLEAFRDFMWASASRRPLLLIWEDLHWCDPSSLQFLEALLPLTGEVPLLLLCALRSDESPARQMIEDGFEKFADFGRCLALRPLSREQSTALIQELLQLGNLPDKMRGIILDRAEGNPFFLEELLRSLIETGTVVLAEGRTRLMREITTVDLPETLQGVVTARIDRLAPEQKQTLQKASVLGRVFQERVLRHLHEPASQSRFQHSLLELQRREFVQSQWEQTAEARTVESGRLHLQARHYARCRLSVDIARQPEAVTCPVGSSPGESLSGSTRRAEPDARISFRAGRTSQRGRALSWPSCGTSAGDVCKCGSARLLPISARAVRANRSGEAQREFAEDGCAFI